MTCYLCTHPRDVPHAWRSCILSVAALGLLLQSSNGSALKIPPTCLSWWYPRFISLSCFGPRPLGVVRPAPARRARRSRPPLSCFVHTARRLVRSGDSFPTPLIFRCFVHTTQGIGRCPPREGRFCCVHALPGESWQLRPCGRPCGYKFWFFSFLGCTRFCGGRASAAIAQPLCCPLLLLCSRCGGDNHHHVIRFVVARWLAAGRPSQMLLDAVVVGATSVPHTTMPQIEPRRHQWCASYHNSDK